MTKLQELLLKIQEGRTAQKADFAAYVADISKMPADVKERINKRDADLEVLEKEARELEELEAKRAANDAALEQFGEFKHHGSNTREDLSDDFTKSAKYLAEAKRIKRLPRYKALEHFKGEDAEVKAYRFAHWMIATVMKGMLTAKGIVNSPLVEKSERYCKEFGIELKVHLESNNNLGGYLVPPEFGQEIIDLRELYGVFRQYSKVVPMMSDTKSWPRRRGGLTVYNPAEGVAITASDKSWDRVSLTARKFACLSIYTSELDEDSMINVGDDLASEIAYAFAKKEDDCGFNGDGTSSFFGITGIREKLKGLSATIANIAGLYVGTGNLWSELVLADFNNVSGLLPAYAETPRTAWFVSKKFWGSVMEKIAVAVGGVTAAEVINGAPQRRFLGYPVVISQQMPRVEANSQVCALFGDISMGSLFGDRRQVTIAYSTDYKFAEDELAIRGTERVDINVHDVGNATSVAADKEPGPIVGLITAAS